jgi:hypothetical protein
MFMTVKNNSGTHVAARSNHSPPVRTQEKAVTRIYSPQADSNVGMSADVMMYDSSDRFEPSEG